MSMIKRYTLEAMSSFNSPLWSDTMSGYFMWLVKYALGEDKMLELIEGFRNGNPPFVLSDAMPQGYLPTPATLRNILADFLYGQKGEDNQNSLLKRTNSKDIRKIEKKIKKSQWLPKELLLQWEDNNDITDTICKIYEDNAYPFETTVQPHNSVDRDLWSSGGDGGNYYEMESTVALCRNLDIYAWASDDSVANILDECFAALEYEGYGADRSTGKGRFKLLSAETKDVSDMFDKQRQLSMSLSHFFPAKNDPKGFAWNVDVKFGRVGERGYGLDVSEGVFKRPVMLLNPGAVFQYSGNNWIGRSIGDIAYDKRVIQIGYGLMLPICERLYPL